MYLSIYLSIYLSSIICLGWFQPFLNSWWLASCLALASAYSHDVGSRVVWRSVCCPVGSPWIPAAAQTAPVYVLPVVWLSSRQPGCWFPLPLSSKLCLPSLFHLPSVLCPSLSEPRIWEMGEALTFIQRQFCRGVASLVLDSDPLLFSCWVTLLKLLMCQFSYL